MPHIVTAICWFTRWPAAAAVNHQHGVPYVTRYYAPALRKGVGQLLFRDETACKWTAK